MERLQFALFGNAYQAKKSASVVNRLLRALRERGAVVLMEERFHQFLTREGILDTEPDDTIGEGDPVADYAVSVGGDGTFLQTVSRVAGRGIPVIGVNTGRMGFLADVADDDLDEAIDSIYDGTCRIELRSMLEVQYGCFIPARSMPDSIHPLYPYALNEVAVLKRDNSSMISIRVEVDYEYLTTYQADGLIVNTPTGSTGYALSVGGPIMSPDARSIGIVPVAPHSLNIRPITLRDDSVVTLTVESRTRNFLVAIDGRNETCNESTTLQIRRAPFDVRVVKRPDSSFFNTLRNKLMWGNDVRN